MARPKKKPEGEAMERVNPSNTDEVRIRWTALAEKRRAWANGEMHEAGAEFSVSPRDADILTTRGFAERI
jgi:hypothetical protein